MNNSKPTYSMRTQDYNYTHNELHKLGKKAFLDHLEQFTTEIWDFIVLESDVPINRSTFIQVGAPDINNNLNLTVEIGMKNAEKIEMYRYYTSNISEILEMLMNYFEQQQIPDISSWEDVSDEMNK